MPIKDLILQTRSYRRFHQSASIPHETLLSPIDLARHSASGSSIHPLKYIISCDPDKNAIIFPHLAWAGYLKDWSGPVEGERLSAYIIILTDTTISKSPGCDHGIAAQSIWLGATEAGLISKPDPTQPASCPLSFFRFIIRRNTYGRLDSFVRVAF